MANTLRATSQFTFKWDYQQTETIGNPTFESQISFGNTYVDTVATGYKANLLYATVISLTSSSTTVNLKSFADRLGNTKSFTRIKSLTMKCTSGVGQARFNYNAGGLAETMLDAAALATVRVPLEAGRCVHYESATTTGYVVQGTDTIEFVWTSGTFTVYLAISGVDT